MRRQTFGALVLGGGAVFALIWPRNPFVLGFALFVCLALGLWVVWNIRDIWNDGPVHERAKRNLVGMFGEDKGLAHLAGFPIGSAFIIVGVLGVLGDEACDGNSTDLCSVISAASYVVRPAVVVAVFLYLSVIFIGRPKAIIPPSLRSHGGMLFGRLQSDRHHSRSLRVLVNESLRRAARRVSVGSRDISQR